MDRSERAIAAYLVEAPGSREPVATGSGSVAYRESAAAQGPTRAPSASFAPCLRALTDARSRFRHRSRARAALTISELRWAASARRAMCSYLPAHEGTKRQTWSSARHEIIPPCPRPPIGTVCAQPRLGHKPNCSVHFR